MSDIGENDTEMELRLEFTRYFKAQEQIKNEISMHTNKATATSSNVDDDVPMIESFYDDGDDLSSRLLATGITQQTIPSLKAKY